ncbi:Undecaprenyl-phosphate galactosephosphotransferase [Candidatus Magnetobacterium bavaricum]|uniref:Undecaprenyl-phosphate galactosephosphotransferase n=1 Tax=Candidatus Magnetobacterium bavaricum TaxID=29290 RepID=A0A0F3GQW3_9BACT|nr:Undecaprenyl-phosphate galactosephosphotransferase [Candidatus Magnetobacterium bavaricum]
MKRGLELACLIMLDILAYYVSLLGAWSVRQWLMPMFWEEVGSDYSLSYYVELWWIPVIYIFFIAYQQTYTARLPFWDETKKLFHAITLAFIVFMAVVMLGRVYGTVSSVVLVMLWGGSMFIFPVFHLYGKRVFFRVGICKEKVLILGAGKAGCLIAQWLDRERHIGYDVVGFLDDKTEKTGRFINGKKVFGRVRHYTRFVRELAIDTIIIAMPSMGAEKTSAMAYEIQRRVRHTLVVPDLYGVAMLNTQMLHLFYEELFLLRVRNNLKSLPNRFVKRFFDVSVTLALSPLWLMLMAIIGILIKLESPGGAVISSSVRLGMEGRPFRCFNFRCSADGKLTRVGRFLEKTSLDELSQLINVLKADMSLIGPRPYLLSEVNAVQDSIDAITSVAPGITGLWQVSLRKNDTYEDRIRLDIWYIMNWSLWLDLFILVRTIAVLFSIKGETKDD